MRVYNTELTTFPGRLWRAFLYPSSKEMATFDIAADEMKTPKVDFGTQEVARLREETMAGARSASPSRLGLTLAGLIAAVAVLGTLAAAVAEPEVSRADRPHRRRGRSA